MARKPPPSLPDVFAKPGAAPSRGTAIEDLPQVVEVAPPPPVSEPEPPPRAVAQPAPMPPTSSPPPVPAPATIVQPDPEPRQPPPLEPPRIVVQPQPEPSPFPAPPVAESWPAPAAAPPPASRRGMVLATVAVAVALTTPFWEDSVLSILGIRTPAGRATEQATLVALRMERRTEDIAQRLSAAMAQMTRQQAEFTAAMQRADHAGTLIRTMALVRLSDTLRRPVPFAAELAVARASGSDLGDLQPLLDQIAPYADTGIPGTTQLRQEFRTLLDQVSRAAPTGPAPSWMASLASWTHLRSPPAPLPADTDPSLDLLRAAAARLADVDTAGAIEQARQISEAYRPTFANWLGDAQARVAADTLAERVSDMVTKTLRVTPAK